MLKFRDNKLPRVNRKKKIISVLIGFRDRKVSLIMYYLNICGVSLNLIKAATFVGFCDILSILLETLSAHELGGEGIYDRNNIKM